MTGSRLSEGSWTTGVWSWTEDITRKGRGGGEKVGKFHDGDEKFGDGFMGTSFDNG